MEATFNARELKRATNKSHNTESVPSELGAAPSVDFFRIRPEYHPVYGLPPQLVMQTVIRLRHHLRHRDKPAILPFILRFFSTLSIKNKLPEFHQLLYSSDVASITLITESWLNSTVADSMLDPRHLCTIFRCDRTDRPGGGVCSVCAMLPHNIKCLVQSFSNNENQLLIHNGCEVICVDAFLQSISTIV